MNKLRVWCPGGRRRIEKARGRGTAERCLECGRRYQLTEVRSGTRETRGFMLPPHKAY